MSFLFNFYFFALAPFSINSSSVLLYIGSYFKIILFIWAKLFKFINVLFYKLCIISNILFTCTILDNIACNIALLFNNYFYASFLFAFNANYLWSTWFNLLFYIWIDTCIAYFSVTSILISCSLCSSCSCANSVFVCCLISTIFSCASTVRFCCCLCITWIRNYRCCYKC